MIEPCPKVQNPKRLIIRQGSLNLLESASQEDIYKRKIAGRRMSLCREKAKKRIIPVVFRLIRSNKVITHSPNSKPRK